MGANVQPVGAAVTPTDKMVQPVGKHVAPTGTLFAPMDRMDMPVKRDLTPPGTGAHGAHSMDGGKRRKLLASSVTIVDDPLDLSHEFPDDYRNWASLLSQIMLKTATADPHAALASLTLQVRDRLAAAADGEPLLPRFHLSEPMLQASMSGMNGMSMGGMGGMDGTMPPASPAMMMHDNGKGMLTKLATMKTFFNFAPCVLSETQAGVMGSVTGLRIAPTLVSVMTNLLEARFDGININPMLLYVQAMGANAQPQGVNLQPALVRSGGKAGGEGGREETATALASEKGGGRGRTGERRE